MLRSVPVFGTHTAGSLASAADRAPGRDPSGYRDRTPSSRGMARTRSRERRRTLPARRITKLVVLPANSTAPGTPTVWDRQRASVTDAPERYHEKPPICIACHTMNTNAASLRLFPHRYTRYGRRITVISETCSASDARKSAAEIARICVSRAPSPASSAIWTKSWAALPVATTTNAS